MSEVDPNRAELLSDLVRAAREQAGRSPEECAQMLGISAEEFANLEASPAELTLPQLETLAMALNVPMSHFWGSVEPREPGEQPDILDNLRFHKQPGNPRLLYVTLTHLQQSEFCTHAYGMKMIKKHGFQTTIPQTALQWGALTLMSWRPEQIF